ncbi:MAG TPA: MFS transporter [Pseudonocardia sp.]|nr:MFS transporter [Pseudonocardia sp.]
MRAAILAMALGAFAIGLTEFAIMGLLPQVAADLAVSVPTAGNLVTAYAVGVVVGAPLLTAAGARRSRRTLLLAFMGLFAVGNGLAALAPGFGTLLAARFLSGLPHGAFFGIAALVAADLAGPTRRASAVGWLFLGLTVANLVGVPAATVFGGVVGWRLAFALIAGVALLCVAGMLLTVPRDAGAGGVAVGLRAELAVLRRPAVLLALAMVVFGCGGLFTFSTYIAPMTTEVTGWPPAAVPVMLALLGLGMTAGTFLGGRIADRMDGLRAAVVVLGAQAVVLLGAVAAVHSRVLAPVAAFAVGALSLALVPVVQTVVVDAARDAPVLASASMQSGFNIANALGAALGGLVLAAGLGYAAPPAVGAVLAAVGVGIALVALRQARATDAGTRQAAVAATD